MNLIKSILIALVLLTGKVSGAQEIPKWKISDLEQYIKNTDKPTIINFWATYCKPCIEEMPYFQQMVKQYESAGVQLLLVNLDMGATYPKLPSLLKRLKINEPVVFLDETNADVFCPKVDEKWSGAIPASLFINNKKGYRQFYEDQIEKEKLKGYIEQLIQ